MKRVAAAVAVLAAVAVGASLASASPAHTGKASATTLTVWVGWSARELSEFKKVVQEYDAKKLTKRNPDGSLKVVGFDPFMGFYQNTAGSYQPLFNGKYFNGEKSSLGSDPSWAKFLRWQKNLIDFYGYKNLVKWQTGAGD